MSAGPVAFLLLLIAAPPARQPATSVERALTVDGRRRTYRLYAPPSAGRARAPLVLVFHGGGGRRRNAESMTRFNGIAAREGFVVAYPDGYGRNWNDGRTDFDATAFREHVDDVAFVRALIADVARVTPIDPKRVFATGISNGAIFSHYLGAKLAAQIAAIAPVVGGMADPFYREFAPSEPVSVFAIQGTKDPLVPIGGGNVAGEGRGRIIATGEAMRMWAAADGASPAPVAGRLPDRDPRDGCTVISKKWTGGRNGTEVWLYELHGAGHTWPGGSQYLPKLVVGGVCRDFDASEAIWAFFRTHPKP
ncbi:MAG TPA: PHB depolymerase family esterase [Gemmatimonadaceae bacterium]|nr:PHB depolymerase family esterase [Gemmatimonadaceae bacterium]